MATFSVSAFEACHQNTTQLIPPNRALKSPGPYQVLQEKQSSPMRILHIGSLHIKKYVDSYAD